MHGPLSQTISVQFSEDQVAALQVFLQQSRLRCRCREHVQVYCSGVCAFSTRSEHNENDTGVASSAAAASSGSSRQQKVSADVSFGIAGMLPDDEEDDDDAEASFASLATIFSVASDRLGGLLIDPQTLLTEQRKLQATQQLLKFLKQLSAADERPDKRNDDNNIDDEDDKFNVFVTSIVVVDVSGSTTLKFATDSKEKTGQLREVLPQLTMGYSSRTLSQDIELDCDIPTRFCKRCAQLGLLDKFLNPPRPILEEGDARGERKFTTKKWFQCSVDELENAQRAFFAEAKRDENSNSNSNNHGESEGESETVAAMTGCLSCPNEYFCPQHIHDHYETEERQVSTNATTENVTGTTTKTFERSKHVPIAVEPLVHSRFEELPEFCSTKPHDLMSETVNSKLLASLCERFQRFANRPFIVPCSLAPPSSSSPLLSTSAHCDSHRLQICRFYTYAEVWRAAWKLADKIVDAVCAAATNCSTNARQKKLMHELHPERKLCGTKIAVCLLRDTPSRICVEFACAFCTLALLPLHLAASSTSSSSATASSEIISESACQTLCDLVVSAANKAKNSATVDASLIIPSVIIVHASDFLKVQALLRETIKKHSNKHDALNLQLTESELPFALVAVPDFDMDDNEVVAASSSAASLSSTCNFFSPTVTEAFHKSRCFVDALYPFQHKLLPVLDDDEEAGPSIEAMAEEIYESEKAFSKSQRHQKQRERHHRKHHADGSSSEDDEGNNAGEKNSHVEKRAVTFAATTTTTTTSSTTTTTVRSIMASSRNFSRKAAKAAALVEAQQQKDEQIRRIQQRRQYQLALRADIDEHHLVGLFPTSGSTSTELSALPKLAMYSRAVWRRRLLAGQPPENTIGVFVSVQYAPMFHFSARSSVWDSLFHGGCRCLVPAAHVLPLLPRLNPTGVFLVPALWQQVRQQWKFLQSADVQQEKMKKWTMTDAEIAQELLGKRVIIVGSGTAACPEDLRQFLAQTVAPACECRFKDTYGSTEIGAAISSNGAVADDCEVEIDENSVVWVKHENQFQGFYGEFRHGESSEHEKNEGNESDNLVLPTDSQSLSQRGFHCTGDLGKWKYFDDEDEAEQQEQQQQHSRGVSDNDGSSSRRRRRRLLVLLGRASSSSKLATGVFCRLELIEGCATAVSPRHIKQAFASLYDSLFVVLICFTPNLAAEADRIAMAQEIRETLAGTKVKRHEENNNNNSRSEIDAPKVLLQHHEVPIAVQCVSQVPSEWQSTTNTLSTSSASLLFSVDNGLLTPSMKYRRNLIAEKLKPIIESSAREALRLINDNDRCGGSQNDDSIGKALTAARAALSLGVDVRTIRAVQQAEFLRRDAEASANTVEVAARANHSLVQLNDSQVDDDDRESEGSLSPACLQRFLYKKKQQLVAHSDATSVLARDFQRWHPSLMEKADDIVEQEAAFVGPTAQRPQLKLPAVSFLEEMRAAEQLRLHEAAQREEKEREAQLSVHQQLLKRIQNETLQGAAAGKRSDDGATAANVKNNSSGNNNNVVTTRKVPFQIFLTGATGHVGGAVLATILESFLVSSVDPYLAKKHDAFEQKMQQLAREREDEERRKNKSRSAKRQVSAVKFVSAESATSSPTNAALADAEKNELLTVEEMLRNDPEAPKLVVFCLCRMTSPSSSSSSQTKTTTSQQTDGAFKQNSIESNAEAHLRVWKNCDKYVPARIQRRVRGIFDLVVKTIAYDENQLAQLPQPPQRSAELRYLRKLFSFLQQGGGGEGLGDSEMRETLGGAATAFGASATDMFSESLTSPLSEAESRRASVVAGSLNVPGGGGDRPLLSRRRSFASRRERREAKEQQRLQEEHREQLQQLHSRLEAEFQAKCEEYKKQVDISDEALAYSALRKLLTPILRGEKSLSENEMAVISQRREEARQGRFEKWKQQIKFKALSETGAESETENDRDVAGYFCDDDSDQVTGEKDDPAFAADSVWSSGVVDVAIHCAAHVDMVQSYNALRSSNVAFTEALARFFATRSRKFVLTSTTSVMPLHPLLQRFGMRHLAELAEQRRRQREQLAREERDAEERERQEDEAQRRREQQQQQNLQFAVRNRLAGRNAVSLSNMTTPAAATSSATAAAAATSFSSTSPRRQKQRQRETDEDAETRFLGELESLKKQWTDEFLPSLPVLEAQSLAKELQSGNGSGGYALSKAMSELAVVAVFRRARIQHAVDRSLDQLRTQKQDKEARHAALLAADPIQAMFVAAASGDGRRRSDGKTSNRSSRTHHSLGGTSPRSNSASSSSSLTSPTGRKTSSTSSATSSSSASAAASLSRATSATVSRNANFQSNCGDDDADDHGQRRTSRAHRLPPQVGELCILRLPFIWCHSETGCSNLSDTFHRFAVSVLRSKCAFEPEPAKFSLFWNFLCADECAFNILREALSAPIAVAQQQEITEQQQQQQQQTIRFEPRKPVTARNTANHGHDMNTILADLDGGYNSNTRKSNVPNLPSASPSQPAVRIVKLRTSHRLMYAEFLHAVRNMSVSCRQEKFPHEQQQQHVDQKEFSAKCSDKCHIDVLPYEQWWRRIFISSSSSSLLPSPLPILPIVDLFSLSKGPYFAHPPSLVETENSIKDAAREKKRKLKREQERQQREFGHEKPFFRVNTSSDDEDDNDDNQARVETSGDADQGDERRSPATAKTTTIADNIQKQRRLDVLQRNLDWMMKAV